MPKSSYYDCPNLPPLHEIVREAFSPEMLEPGSGKATKGAKVMAKRKRAPRGW